MENTSSVNDLTDEPPKAYLRYYERQIIAALCIIASIVGIFGNSFVIFALLRVKKLRTITNVFVMNLSISDMLASIFLPWEAAAVLNVGGWPLPQASWICVTSIAVLCASYGCSFNNLALIAVNRWIGITRSNATTHRIYNRRNIACMVTFAWAFPVFLTCIPLFTDFGEFGYEPLYNVCGFVRANSQSGIYSLAFSLCFSPVQFIIIVLCYTSILRYVLKTSRRMARPEISTVSSAVSGPERRMRKKLWRRQIAVTKNLVYIVLAFVICQTPFVVAMAQQAYTWGIRMTMYAAAILFFNSCVNPIIYAASHPDFKEAFAFLVRCK